MSAAPIYVVVCQNDKEHPRFGKDAGGPIVHESYTSMTLEQAQERCGTMEHWGACRVGRVVFDTEPGQAQDMLDALRQWRAAERDGDAAEMANARAARDAAEHEHVCAHVCARQAINSGRLERHGLAQALGRDTAERSRLCQRPTA